MINQLQLLNKQAPGDILMMTCAIRDLALQHPGQYKINLHPQIHAKAVFQNNPRLTSLDTTKVYKQYTLGYSTAINQCNQRIGHFTQGFTRDLAERLKKPIMPRQMRPEVFLTDEEKDPKNRLIQHPYWIIIAGGKKDFTAKLWSFVWYQQVATQLKKDVYLVQVGSKENHQHLHRPLEGVTNLLGKTNFRQLMTLVYHSDGVICPVTCLMHLAAAFNKPCVVISGGREAWWWEAYTKVNWNASCVEPCPDDFVEQRFLHTLGRFSCCKKGGCWKSGVGEKRLGKNCRHVQTISGQPVPACLREISPQLVVSAVHDYLNNKPIEPEQFPDHLLTPCVSLMPFDNLEGSKQDKSKKKLHVPRRQYGPVRRGERTRHIFNEPSPGKIREMKAARWR